MLVFGDDLGAKDEAASVSLYTGDFERSSLAHQGHRLEGVEQEIQAQVPTWLALGDHLPCVSLPGHAYRAPQMMSFRSSH